MDEIKDKFKSLFNKASNQVARATVSNFQGSGHRLGTAEDHGSNRRVAANATAAAARTTGGVPATSSRTPTTARTAAPPPAAPSQAASSTAARPAPPPASGASRQQAPPAASNQPIKPATEFDPFSAVIGSGAARGAMQLDPTAAAAPAAAAGPTTSGSTPASASSSGAIPAPRPSSAAAGAIGEAAAAAAAARLLSQALLDSGSAAGAAIGTAVELLLEAALVERGAGPSGAVAAAAGGGGATALETAAKLLGNLVALPQEPRYRQLRLSNPGLRRRLLLVRGGLELLAAAGWEVHGEEVDQGGGSSSSQQQQQGDDAATTISSAEVYVPADGFAVFLDDAALPRAAAAYQQVTAALELLAETAAAGTHPPPTAATAAAAPALAPAPAPAPSAGPSSSNGGGRGSGVGPPAVERATRVLLPVTPAVEVPDWFFDRTPADLKAEYLRLRAAREAGQVMKLRHKQQQQQQQQAGGREAGVVRVRFPEGVLLEGRWAAGEGLAALHTWVAGALDPGAGGGGVTFDLVGPDRRVLPLTGTVGGAGLLPTVLLNFRSTDEGAGGAGGGGRQVSLLSQQLLQAAECDWAGEGCS